MEPVSSLARFSPADWEFLASVLAPAGGAAALGWLRDDPEALVATLDQKVVLRAILERAAPLKISPALYFYVLVRHAFVRRGLGEPALADFVAGILAEQASIDPQDQLRGVPGGLTRVADFVAMLAGASGRLRFHLQLVAGKQFLVLTGIFPEFLRQRAARSGAPDLEFYESFGAEAFRRAAHDPHAPPGAPRQLLGQLADCFHTARRSLNHLSSDLLFLGG